MDHKGTKDVNKFCVIAQQYGTFLAAYVYWQTENQLIFWLPSQYDVYDFDALSDSPIHIDLKHGLKNREDDYNERNEMQRSYAEVLLEACQKSGQEFIIKKSN